MSYESHYCPSTPTPISPLRQHGDAIYLFRESQVKNVLSNIFYMAHKSKHSILIAIILIRYVESELRKKKEKITNPPVCIDLGGFPVCHL